MRSLGTLLTILGVFLTGGAASWYVSFYGAAIEFLGKDSGPLLSECFYSLSTSCHRIAAVLSLTGKQPYEPAMLWAGGSLLSIGVLLFIGGRETDIRVAEPDWRLVGSRASSGTIGAAAVRTEPSFEPAPLVRSNAPLCADHTDTPAHLMKAKAANWSDSRADNRVYRLTVLLVAGVAIASMAISPKLHATISREIERAAVYLRTPETLTNQQTTATSASNAASAALSVRNVAANVVAPRQADVLPPMLLARSSIRDTPVDAFAPAQTRAVQLTQAQSDGPKLDIRGYRPGIPSGDVLETAVRAGWTCRKTENLDYIDCKNGAPSDDIKFEELEFYSIAGFVNTITLRFSSGNDFRSLVGVVSNQFGTRPYEISVLDIARWQLVDDFRLEFRKISTSAVLTLTNERIDSALRARAKELQRQRNPAPRF